MRIRPIAALLLLAAAGCPSPASYQPPPAPIADIAALAGGVVIGQAVQLDGSASADPKNRPILFAWELAVRPDGSGAAFDDANSKTPSFVPDVVGSYEVRLVVTNSVGVASAPASLTIAADSCGNLQLGTPVATATLDDPEQGAITGRPHVGSTVTLGATATDPNSACGTLVSPDRFQWSLLSAPAGSHATLTSVSADAPSFVPDVQGSYQLSVVVTDALGNESAAPGVLSVNTTTCGANPPVVTLSPLSASPDAYQNTPLSATVSTSTTDAGSSQVCPARFGGLTYSIAWSIVTTPVAGQGTLGASTGASNTFLATSPGVYRVHASATDSRGLTSDPSAASSFSNLSVSACGSHPPALLSIAAVSGGSTVSQPFVGQHVDLVVNATDADIACGAPGAAVTQYEFDAVSLPAGSAAPASASGPSATFGFTPDVAGTYVYSVRATDDTGLRSPAVQVEIPTAPCGPSVPSISASTPGPVIGGPVGLSLSAPITDGCVVQPTFRYAWSITQRPTGSQALLSGATNPLATLVPDAVGAYSVQLTVTDNGGFSTSRTLSLFVASCGSLPPLINSVVATPAVPNAGELVALTVSVTDPNSGSCAVSLTPFAYHWALLSAPTGSMAQLDSASSATPHFVADKPASSYVLGVTVTDAIGNVSDSAFLTVTTP